jgi:hypothetical protein
LGTCVGRLPLSAGCRIYGRAGPRAPRDLVAGVSRRLSSRPGPVRCGVQPPTTPHRTGPLPPPGGRWRADGAVRCPIRRVRAPRRGRPHRSGSPVSWATAVGVRPRSRAGRVRTARTGQPAWGRLAYVWPCQRSTTGDPAGRISLRTGGLHSSRRILARTSPTGSGAHATSIGWAAMVRTAQSSEVDYASSGCAEHPSSWSICPVCDRIPTLTWVYRARVHSIGLLCVRLSGGPVRLSDTGRPPVPLP